MTTYADFVKADTPSTVKTVADDLELACSGMAEEAGEVIDLHKKMRFHSHDTQSRAEFVIDMLIEAGDTLWYMQRLCSVASRILGWNITITDLAKMNVRKIIKRHPERHPEFVAEERKIDDVVVE